VASLGQILDRARGKPAPRRGAAYPYPPGAKTTKIAFFTMECPRGSDIIARYFKNLREEFVICWINGILRPINEFERPYQSKNNRIRQACENGSSARRSSLNFTSGDDLA
jgi:hypothetical protein